MPQDYEHARLERTREQELALEAVRVAKIARLKEKAAALEDEEQGVRTYGVGKSRGFLYRRGHPRLKREIPHALSVRIPADAHAALTDRAASTDTHNGMGYAAVGSSYGLGKYLTALCALWREKGDADDFGGLYDNRPATIRELDCFRPDILGRDGIYRALIEFRDGGIVEDSWGRFRWSFLDPHVLADNLAPVFPLWSPYDVPRLAVTQALVPPDYYEVKDDWREAVSDLFQSPPIPQSYGLRGATKYGGLGGTALQTTINMSSFDQETLSEIAAHYRALDRNTLLVAIACGWLGHARLRGGNAALPVSPYYTHAYQGKR